MSEHQLSETVTRVAISQIGENGRITVTQEHCVEFMGPDEGPYEFYYNYDVYRFEKEGATLIARSYRDEPDVASLRGFKAAGAYRPLERGDFRSPLVREAVRYLRAIGKRELKWLDPARCDGYTAIPLTLAVDA